MPQFCMHCGTAVSDGARYCAGCGKDTSVIKAAAPDEVASPPQTPASPKKTKWLAILLPTVIGLVLAGGALLYIFVLGKQANKGTASNGEAAKQEESEQEKLDRAPGVGTLGTPLKSEPVKPSSSPQTVAVEKEISITLPAGAVTSPAALTIRPISNPTPHPFKGVRLLKAFDVSLGDQHEFDKELTIEIPFDPAQVKSKVPLKKALLAATWDEKQKSWAFIPSAEVDPERKVVRVRTSHLSSWGLFSYEPSYQILRPPEEEHLSVFAIAYQPEGEFNKEEWPKGMYSYAIDIETYLEQAWKAYQDAGFTMPGRAPYVFIGNYENPNWSSWSGNIRVPTNAENKDVLKVELFHELFHAIQNQYHNVVGMTSRKWWIEATADCMGYHYSGLNTARRLIPRFLEDSLTSAENEHDYDTGRFLMYLLERGLDPKEMWVGSTRSSLEPLLFLEQYVRKETGKDLLTHYREFAAQFLFNSKNKIMADWGGKSSKFFNYTTVQRDALPPWIMGHPALDKYEFQLKKYYSAQSWGVKVGPGPGTGKRILQVSLVSVNSMQEVSSSAAPVVEVYSLPNGEPSPSGAKRLALVTAQARERFIEVDKNDVLYVLAFNGAELPQSVEVSVSDPAIEVSLSPLTVSYGEANKSYTFTATVSGLPAHVKARYAWVSGYHAEAKETDSASISFSYPKQGSYEVTVQVKDSSTNDMLAYATARVHITRGDEVAKEPKRETPKKEPAKKKEPKKEPKQETNKDPVKTQEIEVQTETTYHDAAKTKKYVEYTYYMKDGKLIRHGYYREWFENGKLHAQDWFAHDNKHGASESWDEKGRPTFIQEFKDGKSVPDSTYYWYYDSAGKGTKTNRQRD